MYNTLYSVLTCSRMSSSLRLLLRAWVVILSPGPPVLLHRHSTNSQSYVTSCVILSPGTGWAAAVLYCTPQYSTVLHSTAQLGLS